MISRWLRLGALALPALLGPTSVAPVAESASPAAAPGKGEPLDAEMLRDLDLLNNPDYARDREVAKRMRLLERLRMLESLQALENESPVVPPTPAGQNLPGGSAPKEVK